MADYFERSRPTGGIVKIHFSANLEPFTVHFPNAALREKVYLFTDGLIFSLKSSIAKARENIFGTDKILIDAPRRFRRCRLPSQVCPY